MRRENGRDTEQEISKEINHNLQTPMGGEIGWRRTPLDLGEHVNNEIGVNFHNKLGEIDAYD
jgi:hypothetical protein